MPIVTIEWFSGRSRETKATIAATITEVVAAEGRVPPEDVWIKFVDLPASDWALGGVLQGPTRDRPQEDDGS